MEVDSIMSIDVYKEIPVMGSDKFLLREIEDTDAEKRIPKQILCSGGVRNGF